MAYTTINKSSEYFNTHLYSGNDTTNNQQVGLTPDLVWVKCRNSAVPSHYIVDKVRGDKKYISSNATTAEQTDSATFDLVSGGFNLDGGNGWTNLTGRNYVAWNWKANGSGVSNTDGSIASTVSANDTAGFSIVKYTGTGSAGNVGHGLSTAPKVLINKSISGANDWFVGHSSIGFTKFLKLNGANAVSTNSGIWNNTAPTTDHFTINSANGNTNSTGVEYITYCFAEKKGFSKFGSYIGNGDADGTFVYTGFKPAFVLIKNTAIVDNWSMFNNKTLGYNTFNYIMYPDLSLTESNGLPIDFYSNGFKWRNSAAMANGNGQQHIFMAFAEEPLVGTNNIPATAR